MTPRDTTGMSRVQTLALNVSEEVKEQLLSDIQPNKANGTTIPTSGVDLIPTPLTQPTTTTTTTSYKSRAGEDSDDGGSNILTVPEWIEDYENSSSIF